MRVTAFVALILVTVMLIVLFWLPTAPTAPKMIMQYEYVPRSEKGVDVPPLPASPAPKKFYQKAKEELLSWLEIAGKISPVVTMLLAVRMAKRKKKKR